MTDENGAPTGAAAGPGSRVSLERFIPCTREVDIGGGVIYRPIRSWHSGVYAGEKMTSHKGDASGCVHMVAGRMVCSPPYTVTHRLYWHRSNPEKTVSAFLSYPNGMGSCDEYFWECMTTDCERFFGEDAESQCEAHIKQYLCPVRDEVQP